MLSRFSGSKLKRLFIRAVLFLCLFIFFSTFFAFKINLTNVDIGRHIINGLNILYGDRSGVIHTDFYSYTNFANPHVNHHYLSGVVFFVVYKLWNFVGVSFFYSLLGGLYAFVLFYYAYKKLGLTFALLVTLFFLPFLSIRTEIRPEIFSYILFALQTILLLEYRKNLKTIHYLLIFFLQALCINLHVFALLTFFITFSFLIEAFVLKDKDLAKKLLAVLFVQLVGTLVSPFGPEIFIVPFKQFTGTGILNAESKPLILRDEKVFLLIITIFGFVVGIIALIASKLKNNIGLNMLLVLTAFSSLYMNRLFVFYVSVLFLVVVSLLTIIPIKNYEKFYRKLRYIVPILMLLVFMVPLSRNFGYGLKDNVYDGAAFYLKNNIQGKLYNDYDTGGYSIFFLSINSPINEQGKKVYIHNVPEALPKEFVASWLNSYYRGYIQKDAIEKYNVTSVLNSTGASISALSLRLLHDPQWKPVYYDNYVIIFLKDVPENKALISKYELDDQTIEYILRRGVVSYATCDLAGFRTIKNVCKNCIPICIAPWGEEFSDSKEPRPNR